MIEILLALVYTAQASTPFTISGFSSGAAMATQVHLAFSSQVKGAGILSGTPYHCAQGSFATGFITCMENPNLVNVTELTEVARNYSSEGKIDPVSNLEAVPVYILTGAEDTIMIPGNSDNLEEFYLAFNANAKKEVVPVAAHAFITDNDVCQICSEYSSPYINNCDFNTVEQMFKHLYGTINPPQPRAPPDSSLKTFTQTSYGTGISLADKGYVYLPSDCQADISKCRIHVALHGCMMDVGSIGTDFIQLTGYNEIGEANDIAILYPQTKVSYSPSNPNACWDWWGYNEEWGVGKKYDTNQGPQPKAIVAMVEDLAKGSLPFSESIESLWE